MPTQVLLVMVTDSHPEAEERLSRLLEHMAQQFGSLEGVIVRKALDLERAVVAVVAPGDGAKVVGKEGAMAKLISKELGKPLRVIEFPLQGPMHSMLQNLLQPVSLIGINVLYTTGGEELRIRVPLRDKPVLPLTPEDVVSVSHNVLGRKAVLLFE